MTTEKEEIELHTAQGFLDIFNETEGSDFEIIEISDAPDIRCRDSKGNNLNLEITLTEDEQGDIASALGRSEKKSIGELRRHMEAVRNGKEKLRINCLNENVSENLINRINSKIKKDYGRNVALVVRDTSGVDWSWENVIAEISQKFRSVKTPYDKGIWLLNCQKTKIYKIV